MFVNVNIKTINCFNDFHDLYLLSSSIHTVLNPVNPRCLGAAGVCSCIMKYKCSMLVKYKNYHRIICWNSLF